MNVANSAGDVLVSGTMPCSNIFFDTPSSFTAFTSSSCRRCTTGAGVRAGATTPNQPSKLISG